MQNLSNKYIDKPFNIFCFPSNQFGNQEPWENPKIKEFIQSGWPDLYKNNNVTFFDKINVNGSHTHKTYVYLKEVYPGLITWNFASKFIINKDGIPCARFDKGATWEEIEDKIIEELNQ